MCKLAARIRALSYVMSMPLVLFVLLRHIAKIKVAQEEHLVTSRCWWQAVNECRQKYKWWKLSGYGFKRSTRCTLCSSRGTQHLIWESGGAGPWVVKTLTMAPGGVETSVFHNTVVPESAQVDFSFDTPGMRIFKLILKKYMCNLFVNYDVTK